MHALKRNLLFVFLFSATIFVLLYLFLNKEAIFWTALVAVPMVLLSLIRPSISLKMKYRLISIWDVLLPLIFFFFVAFNYPKEVPLLIFRVLPGLIFFVTMGCFAKVLFGRLKAEEAKQKRNENLPGL